MNSIRVTSSAFQADDPIPRKHTGEGEDVSPALSFEGIPDATEEIVLVCDDPDAPQEQPWVHWLLYGLPGNTRGLGEGDDGGGRTGLNGWNTTGYRGPLPPPGHGVHHYHFKVYALDKELRLPDGVDKVALLQAMAGHVLAEGELIGTYERK